MKNYYFFFLLVTFFISCSRNDNENSKKDTKAIDNESLVEIKDHLFTEYYPGKKQKKFQGEQDNDGQRHGKWTFYSEQGLELSTTHYEHGIKHGASVVKYPNGQIHYLGEYVNDKQVGIWKTYNQKGELVQEKKF
jgi:antitoxin component YwqK of YwqJK toxin-antitoxin module